MAKEIKSGAYHGGAANVTSQPMRVSSHAIACGIDGGGGIGHERAYMKQARVSARKIVMLSAGGAEAGLRERWACLLLGWPRLWQTSRAFDGVFASRVAINY